jgi:hypothetical protein
VAEDRDGARGRDHLRIIVLRRGRAAVVAIDVDVMGSADGAESRNWQFTRLDLR